MTFRIRPAAPGNAAVDAVLRTPLSMGSGHTLALPLFNRITNEQQEEVTSALRDAMHGNGADYRKMRGRAMRPSKFKITSGRACHEQFTFLDCAGVTKKVLS
jgi:hypothetical protein